MKSFPDDLEAATIAGQQVKFVYLDPNGNEAKDSQFMARCHFLPRPGEKIVLGGREPTAFVKAVYHTFLQSDAFERGTFFQGVTVVLTSNQATTQAVAHH